jgi:hypothetical protein
MAKKAYADKLVKAAAAEVGYREKASNSQLSSKTGNAGHNNWNKFAAFIDKNFPTFYNYKKNGYDWCDIFVDCMFLKCFGLDKTLKLLNQPLKSTGAGCPYSYGFYKAAGRVGKTPRVGAQIFFGSSEGNLYHTGIVEKFDSNYVYTIEGNSSDMVMRHTYARSSPGIFGYGYPKYDGEKTPKAMSKTKKWTGYVTRDAAARSGPGTTHKEVSGVGKVKKGTAVDVCDSVVNGAGNKWYYCKFNGKYVYITGEKISKKKPKTTSKPSTQTPTNTKKTVTAISTYKDKKMSTSKKWDGVITQTAATRSGPGTSYEEISGTKTVAKNTTVSVCDSVVNSSGNKWYYCKLSNGKFAWITGTKIKKKSATSSSTKTNKTMSKTKKWDGKVTADSLNVRVWAGTENAKLKSVPTIKKGTKIAVCDSIKDSKGNKWYYIRIKPSTYGFVYGKYIKKIS